MNKSRLLSALILVCLLVTLLPTSAVAITAYSSVTGTLLLPGNETAPAGGVKVSLLIGTDNLTPSNKNDDVEVTYDVTIPQGQNSHSFSMMVPKSSNSAARHTVFYTVGNGYAPFGWYSTAGTVAVKDSRTQINVNEGNVNNLSLQLLSGKIISGKIILGNTKTTLPKEMKVTLTAIQKGTNNSTTGDDIIVSREVSIPGGQAEAAYQLVVPLNTSGSGYMVYYSYQNNGYKEAGYYHTGGTTRSENTVTLIDVSNTVSGINLTTMPFTVISGRIYLDDGNKAGQNLEVILTALNKGAASVNTDDFSVLHNVTIVKDTNYTDYKIAVPVIVPDYTISYTVSKNSGYIPVGFYNKDDTVSQESKATMLDVSETPIQNINLRILKKATPTAKPTSGPKPSPAVTPAPLPADEVKYDLNGDGYVNVFDLLDLAKVIVKKYEKDGFDKDPKQYEKREMTADDMKTFWEVFKPFTNSKYKIKWFNNVKNWFSHGWTFNSDDWKNFNWEDAWKNYNWEKFSWDNWKNYNWEDFNWDDWFNSDDRDEKNNDKGKGKKKN